MVNLGDEVEDTVSGFSGVAICKHEYLHGCFRFSVQPKTNKDGELPESKTFDEPQLQVTKKQVVTQGETDTGGPEKDMPSDKPTGER